MRALTLLLIAAIGFGWVAIIGDRDRGNLQPEIAVVTEALQITSDFINR